MRIRLANAQYHTELRCSDLYDIIMCEDLLYSQQEKPLDFDPGETFQLNRPATVDDICNFIVEYINSDVVVCMLLDLSFRCMPYTSLCRACCLIACWS